MTAILDAPGIQNGFRHGPKFFQRVSAQSIQQIRDADMVFRWSMLRVARRFDGFLAKRQPLAEKDIGLSMESRIFRDNPVQLSFKINRLHQSTGAYPNSRGTAMGPGKIKSAGRLPGPVVLIWP